MKFRDGAVPLYGRKKVGEDDRGGVGGVEIVITSMGIPFSIRMG